ncbi:MAG TPA: glutamine-hydrolyzing GMP synthase [Caldisericia bacterium]|nr:glutamine-hydrolyzing GMP synthase [Caldisericia bacterium]HPF48770.1 glutamine-hydrolyzing GMP synthase [Caldisericia bacterium]HPI83570.1 glutamine-hydrolyzing GMP synthase [Caldisericia bacterium]HPQ93225.1 glutamine-hydrolyzing GMP synthase [Caldisericia bacterium]HRV74942.1 glutamine-hydrolyzing GMP synthase [Caldisericia bacterium]
MIAIIDFGSQYTQLIARRVREAHVYCEVLPYWTKPSELEFVDGIILSGSPKTLSKGRDNMPIPDDEIFTLGKPVLGFCYGMQLVANRFGGAIAKGAKAEFGHTQVNAVTDSPLFSGIPESSVVWMSHGDHVSVAPKDFEIIVSSESCEIAGIQNLDKKVFGLQFHPEVSHTQHGQRIIENFLFDVCHVKPTWRMSAFIESEIQRALETIGDDHVIAGVSGGVDSVVMAVLLHKALGKRLHTFFIDHGLLRMNEREEVEAALHNLGLEPMVINASKTFLSELEGTTDPEEKRLTIGKLFVREFEKAIKQFPEAKWLAQGTLYPDVIESSGGVSGLADKIKSHHNVGGLPKDMKLTPYEPLKTLFKDEVRHLGRELGVPKHLVDRQPFPGPGLAIRIIGEITPKRLDVLRRVDKIVREEIDSKLASQYFAVLLPISSVGVQGDERSYQSVVAVRAVTTTDFMTASWAKLPYEKLDRIATRITGEVREVGRVVYDISNKPPGTIEWE